MKKAQRRMRYFAQLFDNSGIAARGRLFATITDCRKWAESYGTTMSQCDIRKRFHSQVLASHRRDTNGDGTRWFKAVP